MSIAFIIAAAITIAAAVAAMTMRSLVHCALALTVVFGGLAIIYLQLNAQFVGFAQVLVYVGAVGILVVFAILLTRGGDAPAKNIFSTGWLMGTIVAIAVFGILASAISGSQLLTHEIPAEPEAPVQQIGGLLMHRYVLPLEVTGLLLTAAMIGAVILAVQDKEARK